MFLPLTNLCRNRCDYCAFRQRPGQDHTMLPDEVEATLQAGRDAGCTEALFCLGDTPESMFPHYRAQLDELGHESTVDYLVAAGRRAVELGLQPHTNAGILSSSDMIRLMEVNVSLGLMLETTSERLAERGGPHAAAPDKNPAVRLRMLEEAGHLGIPFTTGVLVGIGETEPELIETLVAIRELSRRHGNIQEVIVQPFRAHAGTRMADWPEPDDQVLLRAIALARLILDDDVSIQSPPNLAGLEVLLDGGCNDLGGISPVTPDFINLEHAWPHIAGLEAEAEALGFRMERRLPVYGRVAG
ncbi:MAG: 7,8-didemethyl-8-hydroxy-5-deazariboflavin synthase CofG [Proteobacteria bacterium]|nr:7,8-didemethyl-8-hydroxy-5-deazariboflavin synthase CofG [Pseudomonadota bacterium]MCP4922132.1 7,8-didemethyl-8-hydroxy-5-deazariboflavin synthase CofG [Pseudomonadota bacterium]